MGGVVVSVRVVWVRNVGTDVVAEIRVVGGSSCALHLLPTEEVSMTCGCFPFSCDTFLGDCPGVRILEAGVAVVVRRVVVVRWSAGPHLWECYVMGES